MASVLRMTGDLAVAEDAVQEACLAALAQWPARGWPDQPRAWLTGVARHKAVDLIRREAARSRKEAAAMRDLAAAGEPAPRPGELAGPGGDELGLVFMCCHPALALEARVGHHPQLSRWPQLHLARADLLARLDRGADAVAAYRAALELEPTAPERAFIARRIRELCAGQ